MSSEPRKPDGPNLVNAPLNPALKSEVDPSYGPAFKATDPMGTVSVKKEEGTAWPMIWAVTAIVCVIITILLLL